MNNGARASARFIVGNDKELQIPDYFRFER
jgi:hypothetical protein